MYTEVISVIIHELIYSAPIQLLIEVGGQWLHVDNYYNCTTDILTDSGTQHCILLNKI